MFENRSNVDAFAPVSVLAMGTAVILKRQMLLPRRQYTFKLSLVPSTNTLAWGYVLLAGSLHLECNRITTFLGNSVFAF